MKQLIIAGIVALFATSASAHHTYKANGTVVAITPIYTKVYSQQPQQKCHDVEVPIYGRKQGGNAGEGALGGMIIGGILGKALGGNDQGAAAGAILGGVIGADKSQGERVITGYRTERQCNTTYRNVNSTVVNEYDITYKVQGHQITIRVNRVQGERAWIGQTKTFKVNFQLLN